ncbi:hypothetical protein H0H87_012855 [Tephrocybe sp. NHM501043]|nr:hypothetical protein H0H87_012855 [Tephrocybe sp. NHM501043]
MKTQMAVKGTATMTMGTVRIRETTVPATTEDKAMAKEDKAMAKETTRGVKQAQASRTPPSQAKPSSPSPLVTPNPPSSPGSDPAQTMTTPQPSSSQGATSATVPSGTMSTQILSSPLPFPFSSSSNSGIAIAIPTNGSSGSVPILTSFGAPSPASTNFTPPTSNAPSAASGASHKVNAGAIAGGILGALKPTIK